MYDGSVVGRDGILVMGNAIVDMNKKNTVTGNDVDIPNEGAELTGKYSPKPDERQGRNTTPTVHWCTGRPAPAGLLRSRRPRRDETVPHSADVPTEQHGAKLLEARRRVVERPDDRLALVDRERQHLGHPPVVGLEPGASLGSHTSENLRMCSSARQ